MEIKEYISKVGIQLNDIQEKKLDKYYELLIEKNKVMNLTTITEYEDVIIKHYADSLAVNNVFDIENCKNIIDIGTGAGFPGMVLKIVFENVDFTLVDSLMKRVVFLNEIICELELDKIQALHGRAEDMARSIKHREKYDLCVSRAVANLATLAEYTLPFVRNGGYFISYKAGNCEEEVSNAENAIKILGGEVKDIIHYTMPDTDIQRTFVLIKKISKTSKLYPRKAGLPNKEPL